MANSAGWVVLSRGAVKCTWGGGRGPGDVNISGDGPELPLSHFGAGIVTWRIPYLFRTPPGWHLLMRGPANLPKDGAASLEGIIETDWAVQPAFHSWKLTRPGQFVMWEDGEPICMIVPIRSTDLETWQPTIADMFADEQKWLRDEYVTFAESRAKFNASPRGPKDWQRDYFQGRSPGEARAAAQTHKTGLKLKRILPLDT